MPYDKPKVTIDLEEYNELLKIKNETDKDDILLMVKTVVATIANNRGNMEKSLAALNRENIKVSIINYVGSTNDRILPGNVSIERIR